METTPSSEASAAPARAWLRLVWSNPNPPASPPPRMDLARAIERHLTGRDGLTEEEFLATFSGRARLRPGPVPLSS
jgi:hypothetical protein